MSHGFTLTPKGGSAPARLLNVDDALRRHFGVAPNSRHWFADWYNTIGLGLAAGYSFDALQGLGCWSVLDRAVIDFLNAHYDVRAWRSQSS